MRTTGRSEEGCDGIYQVRMDMGAGPEDLLDGLTWSVWQFISETRGSECLGQHRWAELRAVIQKVMAGRLVRYEACGSLPQCSVAPEKVFWPGEKTGKLSSEINLLELQGSADRFLEGMGAVVERRFGKDLKLSLRERRAWRIDLREQLRPALSKFVYHSHECEGCVARRGFRERRLWKRP